MNFWVRPESELPCAAGRRVEQQREQLAVRLSQQQQPEQRQQQYRVPLCEVDSSEDRRAGLPGRNTQIHGSPWCPSRKPTGRSLFSPANPVETNTRAARGLVTAGRLAANVLAPVARFFALLLVSLRTASPTSRWVGRDVPIAPLWASVRLRGPLRTASPASRWVGRDVPIAPLWMFDRLCGSLRTASPTFGWVGRDVPIAPLWTFDRLCGSLRTASSTLAPVARMLALLLVLLTAIVARAEVGTGFSALFDVDTRWGFGTGSAVSSFFRVDTRFSGSTGEASSGLLTVDTRGADIGSATITGGITDDKGAGLAATVTALQGGVVRARTVADLTGAYTLASLPEGTYQVQAAKPGYLTVNHYGVSLSANQSEARYFSLAGKPSAPAVETTTRAQEPVETVTIENAQLQRFVGGAFVTKYTMDLSKMTVVFTHGWNSDPEVWAKSMAANMLAGGVADINLLAWDWKESARTGLLLSKALSAVPGEGEKLGQALAQSLGGSYGQQVHFVGHSLGTLINAAAANYLHQIAGGGFAPQDTQMTLLDDAALANIEGTLVQLGYTLLGVYAPYEVGSIFNCGWLSPVPHATVRWMDNYISLVGGYHAEAVNTFLAKAPDYADKTDPISFVEDVHGYACRWYEDTVATPSLSLLGNQYSFERLGSLGQFPSPSPYPLGSFFSQDLASSQELALTQLHTEEQINAVVKRHLAAFGVFGVQSALNFAVSVAQAIGRVTVDVGMSFIPHTPSGTPVFTGTAETTPAYYTASPVESLPVWSFQVNLQNQPRPQGTDGPRGSGVSLQGGTTAVSTNQPACVWIPIQIPANAALFSFDFSFNGEPAQDLLTASIRTTNVFALEARFMPANTLLNSGPIDVSQWAGQTVELYFGLVGGTSTNASATLDGMRFYKAVAPSLQTRMAGHSVVLTWPLFAVGYFLETSTSLTPPASWTVVPDAPTVVDFQLAVTNRITDGSRFYRLRKP